MSDETQALCFLAGANSIFFGTKLLTTPNPEADHDDTPVREARRHGDGDLSSVQKVFLRGGVTTSGAAMTDGVRS